MCHGCGEGLGADRYDDESHRWIYECPDCPGVDGPLTIEVAEQGTGRPSLRGGGGIMATLGVYDGIIEALAERPDQYLEFAVLEHLYARSNGTQYRELVERYGHVAIEPDTNTASWMIGRAAWALQREGETRTKSMKKGTGRWDYLSPCHAWALPGVPDDAAILTWEDFALEQGFSSRSHPAIDWRDTPNAVAA